MVYFSYFLLTLLMVSGLFLIGLILLQRGRGGGLAGAFGGMGGQSAFGTKAGDVFTRITIGVATAWILLCAGSVVALHNASSMSNQDKANLGLKADVSKADDKKETKDDDWSDVNLKAPADDKDKKDGGDKADESKSPAGAGEGAEKTDAPATNEGDKKEPEKKDAEADPAKKVDPEAKPAQPGSDDKKADEAAKPAEPAAKPESKPNDPASGEQKPADAPPEKKPE